MPWAAFCKMGNKPHKPLEGGEDGGAQGMRSSGGSSFYYHHNEAGPEMERALPKVTLQRRGVIAGTVPGTQRRPLLGEGSPLSGPSQATAPLRREGS